MMYINAFLFQYYGLAFFARNFVIASDEGAKQSPEKMTRNIEIASSQAPRNDNVSGGNLPLSK